MSEVLICTEPTINNTKDKYLDENLQTNLKILDKFSIKGQDVLENWKKIEHLIKQ